jgi:hypothetical protein
MADIRRNGGVNGYLQVWNWVSSLFKMLFAERPAYKKRIGVRTPIYACPVNALTAMSDGKSRMAHRTG